MSQRERQHNPPATSQSKLTTASEATDRVSTDQRQGAARYPSTVLQEGATYGSCNAGRPPCTSPVLPRIKRVLGLT